MSKKSIFRHILFALILVCLTVAAFARQSTAFTYQGKLTDAGNPANGNYDLQFRLFNALVSGVQVGSTLVRDDVPASNGIFTVTLDFAASAFPGANRWLEVSVRPGASTDSFTSLSPLQPISSTPYAIQSLNAATASGLSSACVGCVTGAQIGSLPTSSGNYIQNSATLQAASNFNISGNGFIGGALGIGTTTPAHALQVNGITSLGGPGGIHGQSIDGPFPGPYPSLSFNTFYNGSSYLAGVAGYAGIFQFQDGDGQFGFYSTGSSVAAGEPHTFIPRLIVHNDGDVGIGTTTPPQGKLHVDGGVWAGVYASSTGNPGVVGSSPTSTGVKGTGSTGVLGEGLTYGVFGTSPSPFGYGVFGESSNWAGYFSGNVRVTGTVTQNSDARLKQEVASLGYGLREVLQLRPVTWNWKDRPDSGRQLGLIAQEVETVLPELVSTDKDAEQTKGLNYIGLIPVTIKAIQEQQAQIEDQQKRITEQQEQNSKLEARLAALEKLLSTNTSSIAGDQ